MFKPKKTIPKLAVAALALTGCSSDGGGGTAGMGGAAGMGGTGGSGGGGDFDSSLNAFCMEVDNPCWGYTVESCTAYYNAVNDYNADAQCTAALISYFDCGPPKTCDEVRAGACAAEYNAMWDVCDELP